MATIEIAQPSGDGGDELLRSLSSLEEGAESADDYLISALKDH